MNAGAALMEMPTSSFLLRAPAEAQWRLGATGITTSRLALGCSRIGSALTPLSRTGCVRLIEAAYALGVRHFDTADIYGHGDSERFLGEVLHGVRGQVCLSSKAGQRPGLQWRLAGLLKGPLRWAAARRPGVRRQGLAQRARPVLTCFEPAHVERALAGSLKRLRTDHLDLFYMHSPAPEVLDDERLMRHLERLRARGLFRALGVSCDDPATAWRATRHEQVQVLQFAFDSSPEAQALVDHAARRGKALLLRGVVRGEGARGERALVEGMHRVLALPASAGLIVGTTNVDHLRSNVAAFGTALEEAA